jgi:hypothetical protein
LGLTVLVAVDRAHLGEIEKTPRAKMGKHRTSFSRAGAARVVVIDLTTWRSS